MAGGSRYILVGHMESPSLFFISPDRSFHRPKPERNGSHEERVEWAEYILNTDLSDLDDVEYEDDDFEENENVSIKHNGKWVRAKVRIVYISNIDVDLLDYGFTSCTVERANIRRIRNREIINIPPLSSFFVLNGLKSILPKPDFRSGKMKDQISNSWNGKAEEVVNFLVHRSHRKVTRVDKAIPEERTEIGDLLLVFEDSYKEIQFLVDRYPKFLDISDDFQNFSVKKFLVSNNFALDCGLDTTLKDITEKTKEPKVSHNIPEYAFTETSSEETFYSVPDSDVNFEDPLSDKELSTVNKRFASLLNSNGEDGRCNNKHQNRMPRSLGRGQFLKEKASCNSSTSGPGTIRAERSKEKIDFAKLSNQSCYMSSENSKQLERKGEKSKKQPIGFPAGYNHFEEKASIAHQKKFSKTNSSESRMFPNQRRNQSQDSLNSSEYNVVKDNFHGPKESCRVATKDTNIHMTKRKESGFNSRHIDHESFIRSQRERKKCQPVQQTVPASDVTNIKPEVSNSSKIIDRKSLVPLSEILFCLEGEDTLKLLKKPSLESEENKSERLSTNKEISQESDSRDIPVQYSSDDLLSKQLSWEENEKRPRAKLNSSNSTNHSESLSPFVENNCEESSANVSEDFKKDSYSETSSKSSKIGKGSRLLAKFGKVKEDKAEISLESSVCDRKIQNPLISSNEIYRNETNAQNETPAQRKNRPKMTSNAKNQTCTIIHVEGRKVKPVFELDNLSSLWHQELYDSFVRKKFRILPVQEGMFPCIAQERSVVAIADKGKTTGYLLPIINDILTKENICPLPPNKEPLAVIISPTWRFALEIGQKCSAWLSEITSSVPYNNRKCSVQTVYDNEKEKMALLFNGCHILVTTPRSLLRLIELKVFNLTRCCMLVFDDAHQTFEFFAEETFEVMKLYKKVHDRHKQLRDQVIISSRFWNFRLNDFISTCLQSEDKVGPAIIISDPVQATLYGLITHAPYLCEDLCDKLAHLKTILDKISEVEGKGLILCKDFDSGSLAYEYLTREGFCCYFINEKQKTSLQQERIKESWENRDDNCFSVLILVDGIVLDSGPMETTKSIIHFDLPETKTGFGKRYLHLRHTFAHFYKNYESYGKSYVLVTKGDDTSKLNAIYTFFKQSKHCTIPNELEDFFIETRIAAARNKTDFPLCDELKTKGKCKGKLRCKFRHFFSNKTEISHITNGSAIFFKVKEVLSPVKFYIQIERIIYPDGTEQTKDKKMKVRLEMKLAKHRNAPLESVPLSQLRLGQIYLIFVTMKSVKRVEVISMKKNNSDGEIESVQVLFIDEGRLETVKDKEFFVIPSDLQELQIPRQCLEIVMIGLIPQDNDIEWSRRAINVTEVLVKDDEAKSSSANEEMCRAIVVFASQSTIFTEEVESVFKLSPKEDTWITPDCLRKTLLQENLASINDRHLEKFNELCKAAEIDCITSTLDKHGKVKQTFLKKNQKQSLKINMEQYSHAFLDINSPGQVVIVTEVISPDLFYVRHKKFSPQLASLEDKLKRIAQKRQCKEVCIGRVYFSQIENNFFRVRALDTLPNGDILVFSVDLGWKKEVSKENLYETPKELLAILPFQAIECKLNSEETWSAKGIEFFSEETLGKDFHISAESKTESVITGNTIYSISILPVDSSSVQTLVEDEIYEKSLSEAEIPPIQALTEPVTVKEKVTIAETFHPKHDTSIPGKRIVDPKSNKDDVFNNRNSLETKGAIISETKSDPEIPPIALTEPVVIKNYEMKLPMLVEYLQYKDKVNITVTFHPHQSINPLQSNLIVEPKSIFFEWLEILKFESSEDEYYIHHKIPEPLSLFGYVDPEKTTFKFLDTKLIIQLTKCVNNHWKKTFVVARTGAKLKYPWLRQKYDSLEDSDEDQNSKKLKKKFKNTSIALMIPEVTPEHRARLKKMDSPDRNLPIYYPNLKPDDITDDEDPENLSDPSSEEDIRSKIPKPRPPMEYNPDIPDL